MVASRCDGRHGRSVYSNSRSRRFYGDQGTGNFVYRPCLQLERILRGGHFGVAWGSSDWSAGPGISSSTNLFQTIDTFDEGGSFFAGLQGGYNYILPNRILLGAEVDASFPAWPTLPSGVNPFGVSIGGTSTFNSPSLGAVSLAETVLSSGTVRGRIGYAPGNWLFYATGGFAWTYNQQSLTRSVGQ